MNPVALVALAAVVVTILGVGFFLGLVWARRRIDHRWYCGSFHPADHPCSPRPEYLERQRNREADLRRAEALEDEAEMLRRRFGSW
jgi:hypothetical protein